MNKEPKKENDKSRWEKIKSTFKPTEISQSDEALFDICMKCGRRLPDRKLATLKAHQKSMHPITNKEKRSTFMYKHMVLLLFSFMIVTGSIIVLVPDAFEIPFDLFVSDEATINVEACTDRTLLLKQKLFVQGEFTSNDAVDMNYLMQECNASFWSYKYGGTIFESDMYSPDNMDLDELRETRTGTKLIGTSLPATKMLGE